MVLPKIKITILILKYCGRHPGFLNILNYHFTLPILNLDHSCSSKPSDTESNSGYEGIKENDSCWSESLRTEGKWLMVRAVGSQIWILNLDPNSRHEWQRKMTHFGHSHLIPNPNFKFWSKFRAWMNKGKWPMLARAIRYQIRGAWINKGKWLKLVRAFES